MVSLSDGLGQGGGHSANTELLGTGLLGLEVLRPHLQHLLEVVGHGGELGLQLDHHPRAVGLLVMTLSCSLGSKRGEIIILSGKYISVLGYVLQLADLFVELSDVVLDDVSQLLDLHGFVIEDGFPLAEKGKFLQLGVGVGDVLADALGDVDEL